MTAPPPAAPTRRATAWTVSERIHRALPPLTGAALAAAVYAGTAPQTLRAAAAAHAGAWVAVGAARAGRAIGQATARRGARRYDRRVVPLQRRPRPDTHTWR